MKEIYDVIIIGAGLSGSNLAFDLDQAVGNILLVDKRIEENNSTTQEKPCSGLVAVPAQPFLEKMLAENTNNILAAPDKLKIRIVDVKRRKVLEQKEIVYNINRQVMEKNLFDLIPDHIEVARKAVFLDYSEVENGLKEVTLKVNNVIKTVLTRILVGADGANSMIRKKMMARKKDPIEKYTGIEWFVDCGHYKVPPFFNIIIDERLTDYYLWAFPKNNQLLVGGIFKNISNPKVIPRLLLDELNQLNLLSENIEITKMWAHPILRPLQKTDLISDNGNGVYLIGEAAGLICPTSAEGYSYAFSSSRKLAETLNKGTKKIDDKQNINRIRQKISRQKIIYNQSLRGIYMTIFGKSY